MRWQVIYEKAIRDDGSLLFPERLSREFLDQARKTMGSYLFANQYQNEVVPSDEKKFKKEWLRYFKEIPTETYRYCFVDPAIGQKNHHDFTAFVVIDVDADKNWYVRLANRYRITPTEIISKMFEVSETFRLKGLGVESVAYQEALLYFLSEEMRRRGKMLPVTGVTRSNVSKETRILGLVPRFEWNGIYLAPGLIDLENELASFPRAAHDDLLDALASLEEIVSYPVKQENKDVRPGIHEAGYEKWYLQQLAKGSKPNVRPRDPHEY